MLAMQCSETALSNEPKASEEEIYWGDLFELTNIPNKILTIWTHLDKHYD
jgi:hypothetical protein